MMTSILHRITGVALAFGILLVVLWFLSAAISPFMFNNMSTIINSIVGRLIMLASLIALYYHFCAGIRHLIWDLGFGFELEWVARSSVFVVAGTIILTCITLFIIIALL
jgi:succinate dehydrogenase / fumarate reductase cytochrome b subunit